MTEFAEPSIFASEEESFWSEKTVDLDGDGLRRRVSDGAGMTAYADARVEEGDALAWKKMV